MQEKLKTKALLKNKPKMSIRIIKIFRSFRIQGSRHRYLPILIKSIMLQSK
jgi:hypothetical protein